MSDGFPHELTAALDGGQDGMDDYVKRHTGSEIIRDIRALCELIRDMNAAKRDAMDRRDYLAANAPPLPRNIAIAWERHVAMDTPDAMKMPWSEYVMNQLAVQEARWRRICADQMIRELDRKIKEPTDGR